MRYSGEEKRVHIHPGRRTPANAMDWTRDKRHFRRREGGKRKRGENTRCGGSEIPLSLAQTTVNSGGPGPERVRSLNLSRHRRLCNPKFQFENMCNSISIARLLFSSHTYNMSCFDVQR